MRRLLIGLLCLATAGGLALVGFAVFSDLPPPQRQVVLPIEPE